LLAREDLELEIPEELEVALEEEIESYQSAFDAAVEEETPNRETIEAEIRDTCRNIPANWNFRETMRQGGQE
jgi:hypothetical protein